MQLVKPSDTEAHILFIFGCQRSGTTLLTRIFEGDPTVCCFAEHSRALTRSDHYVRTRTLSDIEQVFHRCRGSLIVSKPLVESHRANEFLEYFPNAQVVWAYRHYREVVRSFVKRFDYAAVNIIRKIVKGTRSWASESISPTSRELALRFYSPGMSPTDAAALFWLIRNELFFEQILEENRRVTSCQYSDLVSRPDETMRRLYSFLGRPYPGPHLVEGVYRDSKGRGKSLRLDPEIEALCMSMWARLKETGNFHSAKDMASIPTV